MTTQDDIRKALPMLDDSAVELMIGTGVSVPLVSSVVAALRKHGHVMPSTEPEVVDAAARTITAVAGLVNAFEGRDPFSGVTAHTYHRAALKRVRDALKSKLVELSPVADADDYRAAFAELVDVEAELGARPPAEPSPDEVRAEFEVRVEDLAAAGRLDVPDGTPLRIVVGHLPEHISRTREQAVLAAAYWNRDSGVTLAGSGPGLLWLHETVTKHLAAQRRSDAAYPAT